MTEERQWHKATYSGGSGSCVEVSEGTETLVRDTQNRELGHLGFQAGEWTALLGTLAK
ncbi:DUF397 domain-containing protein [Nocardiopsis flavescens]|uniref:DUF397 domain-containing protein n=1 Tax=Nocardiopsis flavescens TaxID=758803 RepID=UPI00364D0E6B